MSRWLAAPFALCCALACFDAAAADPMSRTWSDTTGRFKIKGTFVSLENNVVTIRKEDGKEVEIPFRKLGPADQALAKAAAESAENPFKEKGEESPFKEKGATAGEMKKEETDEAATAESADAPPLKTGTVEVDWNAANSLDPQPEHSNWSEAIKPEQLAEGAPTLKPKTIRLPNRRDFFENIRAVLFGPSGEKGLVGYTLKKGADAATTRLALFDAKSGKSLGSGEMDGEYVPCGLDSSGRRLLVRKVEFGFGGSDAVEVWGLGKSGIAKGLSWTPYGDQEGPKRDVKWGAVPADGRGLTLGASGRLALWNLDEGEPLWYLDLPREHTPAVSPNGKYLAYEAESAIGLLDLEAGKVLALLPTEKLFTTAMAFSPDGKFLAVATNDTLFVYDMTTGSQHREIGLQKINGFGGVCWTDPEHVLVGGANALAGTTLIHVESRIPVWQFTGAANAQSGGGIAWFYVSGNGRDSEALVGADLPHAAAESALKSAMADPNFFLLKPGATVALDLSGIPDADRPTVTESVRKSVLAAGFKIAGSAPVTLKASMRRGENREIRYHTFGTFNDQTYNVQEYVLNLAFVADGKNAWETGTTHLPAPFFVSLKQGQTMADLLKEHDKPGYEFFANVRLPKFVPRPSERPALGSSAVAMQGIR